jgi:peptide/nickel transport system ATP-binding protein
MDPTQRTTLPPLQGDPPDPIDLPAGCRFHDRCPHAAAVCATRMPVLRESTVGHFAACHLDDPSSGHPEALSQSGGA